MKNINKFVYYDYVQDNFIITIINNYEDYTFEFWLRKRDYGISYFCFGILQVDTSYNDFLNMVKRNLQDYIINYNERFSNE